MSSERNLGENFNQYFEILPALDAETRSQVYRIRHEVYCRDLGWEPVREDGEERDAYDAQSVHVLMRRRGTGELVGCTRVILTNPADPRELLPVERGCLEVLDRKLYDPERADRAQLAEVSRLAVMRNFRQRKGENEAPGPLSGDDFEARGPQSRFPFIPVGLYLGAAEVAKRFGRELVLVLTEPRLAVHFSRIGFAIHPIGGAVEHRGVRVPSMLHTTKVVNGLRPLIRPLYDTIEAQIEAVYARQG